MPKTAGFAAFCAANTSWHCTLSGAVSQRAEGLQEFQVDGLLFYPLELIKGVLVLSPQWPRRLTARWVAGAGEPAVWDFELMTRR